MSKSLIILAVLVFGAALYVWLRPMQAKPTITMPAITSTTIEPTQAEAPNMKDVKTEDITIGSGAEVIDGSKVSVQYRGTLTDGTEFDSSYSRDNTPLDFTVGAGQMIPGFDYGVRGMKQGGVRNITIPPGLGYGARAVGSIPANSTLIFEVTMEKVE